MYLIIILCLSVAWVWGRKRARIPRPPGFPDSLPIVGNAHQIWGDSTYFWTKLKEISHDSLRQGGVTSVKLGHRYIYVITDPDDCATVAATCLDKPFLYDFASNLFTNALFVLQGNTWRRHRKLLNPLFNQNSLNNRLKILNVHAKTVVMQLKKHVGKGPFIPTQYLIDSTLRCVAETILGLKNDNSGHISIYAKAMDKYLNVVTQRLQRMWLFVSQIYERSSLKKEELKQIDIVQNISNAIVQRRKEDLKSNVDHESGNANIVLDTLLNLSTFDDNEIRDHCDFLVVASYDAAYPVLTYTLLFLGSHQDIQDKLFKELQEVIGSADNDVSKYDVPKLVYLEAVIKESLRLYSSAPIIARQIDTNVKLKNFTLKKDTICVLSLYGVNRHPIWGDDANQFKPDRWLEPGRTPDNPNAYMAFSVGKRNCLVDEQSTSTVDADSAVQNGSDGQTDNKNGKRKILQRLETVPDIKRDTSGITTQYIATGIVNLGAFASGVCVAWSSSTWPLLITKDQEYPLASASPIHEALELQGTTPNGLAGSPKVTLSESEGAWVASLLCLGALWGAVPSGLISEYFGRKKTLLYLALPLVVSWILVGSSPNVYGLYVGRFVGGVAVGAFSVAIPPYVEDIAEKQLLSTLANFYHVQFSGGILFGYIIGLIESTSWISFLSASIPFAFFVAFIFLPESPAYLMSQGKSYEAKAALQYFRGIDNDIDSELKALREYLRNAAVHKVTFQELFSTRATVKALVVSFGLMIFQQMSGIYPVLFYATKNFETFSFRSESSLNPPSAAIILGFLFVSSTYFSTMLLKVVRRRVLLMISFACMALSLGSLAIYYHLRASSMSQNSTWMPTFALCIFVIVYACGAGPIPWLMLREIFPPNVTRRATAITAGFHWFLAFGVIKLYQNLEDLVKPGWTLWYFAVTCIVGTIFVYFFVPETKGRTLHDIQNEFDGIHKRRKHRHVIEVESLSEA